MQKTTRIIDWLFRIAIAVILLQTLYFKFTGHPESVALFSKLGVEPWGRIGTGVIELIAGLLILVPATALIGAALSLGLMAGAIASHLFVIGIESDNDGGQLFMLAIIVLALSLVVLAIRRKEIPVWLARLKKTT
ncbi:MAG: DoxX family protein [Chitinophagaceae bacterium]